MSINRVQFQNGLSMAEFLERYSSHLGVHYKAARLIKHMLLQDMIEREASRVLDGRVEIDDVYLGGEREGKRGRGCKNKVSFVVAVQTTTDGQPVALRMDPVVFTNKALAEWALKALSTSSCVRSDGLKCYAATIVQVASHTPIVVGSGRQSVERAQFRCVNTVISNLKTAISGTYYSFKFNKYIRRYLAEVQYRFNRRYDRKAILARLLRAAAVTGPRPERVFGRLSFGANQDIF